MSYRQIYEPVFKVSCDGCNRTKVVGDKSGAYESGFREITITVYGATAHDAFLSVIVWMCEECKSEFDQAVKPFIESLFATKT